MRFRYNDILWVEDYPDIICSALKRLGNPSLTVDLVLDRVTFALDLESAIKEAQAHNFDLYVSDGDYPDYVDRDHCENVKRFLNEVRVQGTDLRLDLNSDSGGDISSNFLNFYQTILRARGIKPVILSANILNAALAFNLDLPYYCKGTMSAQEIRAWVQEHSGHLSKRYLNRVPDFKFRDISETPKWICGSLEYFAKEFLL